MSEDESISKVNLYLELKWTDDKYIERSTGRLVSVVRGYGGQGKHAQPFLETCLAFDRQFSDALDTINLADQLSPEVGYFERDIKCDVNLGVLREIRRICLGASCESHEFGVKSKKQIGLKEKYLIPIAEAFGFRDAWPEYK